MSSTLVLIRHGQSEWNQKNIFTGWEDVLLSNAGKLEALAAQRALMPYQFDAVFTSALTRAQDTAKIVLDGHHPTQYFCSEALNERHYGALQGKNKDEMRQLYGKELVELWRRSFDVRPPGGESLKDTCDRVIPYFDQEIKPRLLRGETVLISAHGNSLRALIKYLEHLSDDAIVNVEISTGIPIVYKLDDSLGIVSKTMLRNEGKEYDR